MGQIVLASFVFLTGTVTDGTPPLQSDFVQSRQVLWWTWILTV